MSKPGAMDNSPLGRPVPNHLIGMWKITHRDGTIKHVSARLAFEACKLTGWTMGELDDIRLVKTATAEEEITPELLKKQMLEAIAVCYRETRGINGPITRTRLHTLGTKVIKLYEVYSKL